MKASSHHFKKFMKQVNRTLGQIPNFKKMLAGDRSAYDIANMLGAIIGGLMRASVLFNDGLFETIISCTDTPPLHPAMTAILREKLRSIRDAASGASPLNRARMMDDIEAIEKLLRLKSAE